jgi:cell filamentation protein, protein adenylyltransferase
MTFAKIGRGRPSRRLILESVDIGMSDLARTGGLPTANENEQIWRDIWYEEAHNSTAIEGNTLALKQVKVLLDEGRPIGNKELCEYLEVQGYAQAATWVYSQASKTDGWGRDGAISQTELREIHRLTVQLAWEVCPPENPPLDPGETAGNFRRHDIAPFPDGMVPPPYPEVDTRILDWLKVVNAGPRANEHLLVHLASVHVAFEGIHPFRDGNGRVGRLVMNLLLVRNGYPPAIVRKKTRPAYLRAIRQGDRGDPAPMAEILARAVKESLDRFLLPNLAGPAKLMPLSALERQGLNARGLRAAVDKGRLKARRDEHGRWLSTRQWVDEYLSTRSVGRPRKSDADPTG